MNTYIDKSGETRTWAGVAEAWTKASATPFSAMANTSALYHANAPCRRESACV